MVLFGSLSVPFKIDISLSFINFSAIIMQFSFKKIKFGDLRSSPEWPLIS